MGQVKRQKTGAHPVAKCPTGIHGVDEITQGGLPKGRPTLLCGPAGAGKTVLGIEFLVRGAREAGEPGVCISFEETPAELNANMASLGVDLAQLVRQKKLALDHIALDAAQFTEAGVYDLEPLFARLDHAVKAVGAKRVFLDNIETLYSALSKEAIIRSELRRLFRWLKDRNLTTVITAESAGSRLTRRGIEEFVSDCVIVLKQQVRAGVTTRYLRVVKYRGSAHGSNEYPFLIDNQGVSVLPVTSLGLRYSASTERASTGLPELDAMLSGRGYFRGSSILISGTAGTGKTSLVSHFVEAACQLGRRAMMFSFEESPEQIVRNMRSIGIDLRKWTDKQLLRIEAARATSYGLEMHLVKMHRTISEFKPAIVVIDPVTAMLQSGSRDHTRAMLLRLVDFLKQQQITAVMTTLTGGIEPQDQTDVEISSLVDVWILLRDIESGGERNRGLFILKARGMAHSNQIREYELTRKGVNLKDFYLEDPRLVTGTARVFEEATAAWEAKLLEKQVNTLEESLHRKRGILQAQIKALQENLVMEERETENAIELEKRRIENLAFRRQSVAQSRRVNMPQPGAKPRRSPEGAAAH